MEVKGGNNVVLQLLLQVVDKRAGSEFPFVVA